ncbi:MAG: tetratricopeptide repeat protein [Proteobacteria bacterium]|nr:tetratricopeptide repeat protein [Pseudomonadota bacterium]
MRRIYAWGRIGFFVSALWIANGFFASGLGISPAYAEDSRKGPGLIHAAGSSAYWADKAGLCATYGNDKAAVGYYQKAIDLNPNQSDLYYFKGMCLGELGEYEKAMEAVNKAISMNPEKAGYLYGRGRLGLKAGHKESAMADLESAAKAGDRDAKNHLNSFIR